jgi:two-component system, OmpR family, response regulator
MHIPFSSEHETGDPLHPSHKKDLTDGLPTLADLLTSIGAMLVGQGRAKGAVQGIGKAPQPGARDRRPGVYRFDGWRLDRLTGRLTNASGGLVPLTERESALLVIFLDAPGQLLMRRQLADVMPPRGPNDPSIELEILGLRRKLETDPRFPEVIVTDRDENGVGYVFALDVEGL